jgi:hypothetical protein
MPAPLELTRAAIASGNGGDFEAMMAFYGPESTMDMTGVGLGRYSGLASIRLFLENWIGSTDAIQFELEEARDMGSGVAFAVIRQAARPSGSEAVLRLRYAAVYLWAAGVAVHVTHYPDVAEAQAAARLLAELRA